MTNRYRGTCYKCGGAVLAGEGRTWRAGRRWLVACSGCRGKREEAGGSVGAEGPADFGAAAMEAAQGIDEVRAPARRRPAETRETADARHDRRAAEAREAVAAGRQPEACCTCGVNLELYQQEKCWTQCLGCKRDMPGHGVPKSPADVESEADRAEDDGGGPYPERLRGRLEGLGVTEFAAAV